MLTLVIFPQKSYVSDVALQVELFVGFSRIVCFVFVDILVG